MLERSLGPTKNDPINDLSNREIAINMLQYYPTPDAIRNLVLIAGIDAPTNLEREAGKILLLLSKKPEWKNILDEAEKVYPELSKTRPVLTVLKSLRDDEFGYYPEIREVSQNLALSILESKPKDQRLTALAEDALTNESILDFLVKKGTLSHSVATSLKEAERILLQKSQQNTSTYGINKSFFPNSIRSILYPLLHQQEGITADAKSQIRKSLLPCRKKSKRKTLMILP